MSTFNGENFLKEQIESILKQDAVDVKLLVRDDGSNDNTPIILKRFSKNKNIEFYEGQNLGYSKSFLNLIDNSDETADYYAFSDQDDFWLSNKLIKGINELKEYDNSKPLLYVSSLTRVNKKLEFLSIQEFKNLKISLGAEFTRHRLAGCTFIFNKALVDLLKIGNKIDKLNCSHDKLATILCLACDGKVIFDKNSYILFRRHGNNTSSDSMSIYKKIYLDVRKFIDKPNASSNLAKIIIEYFRESLTSSSYQILYEIGHYQDNLKNKLKLIANKNIDCGFWYYNLFIKSMIIIGKF